MRASGCGWPTAAVPDGASLPYGRALGDVDSEEDVADALDCGALHDQRTGGALRVRYRRRRRHASNFRLSTILE